MSTLSVRALTGPLATGRRAALGVHVAVGYLDAGHLAPAVAGLLLYVLALALAAPYLLAAEREA